MTLGQRDVVLPPHLILRDTIKGSVITHSWHAGKRAQTSLFIHLGLHINFAKSEFCLTAIWWGSCVGIQWTSLSLYHPTNILRSSSWLMLWYRGNLLTVHQVMYFLGKTTFCGNGHAQLFHLYHVIQSDMLMFTILLLISFFLLPFCFSSVSAPEAVSFAPESDPLAVAANQCG